ncbi:Lysophospholipase 1 [Cryomyces minteri]|uniref:Lysophospholipase n=1 Tax=Cryomyces minteri TaxID=331657 RepID=A0A4U0XVY1_9PEZI|nr:Lysophospholipase 1 [Cryomyces minteri]
MKLQDSLASLLTASSVLSAASASVVVVRNPTVDEVGAEALAVPLTPWKRATAEAPNNYIPTEVDCPSTRPTIRSAASLSNEELAWLPIRRNNTVTAMRNLLTRVNITGFDAGAYLDTHSSNASNLPNIGIAASGGGYRALMNGAGNIAAFDSRTANSTGAGHLGGLLQSATYLAGLSGGGWLVGSLYVNNFTSVQQIIDTTPDTSGSLWQFGNSIFEGPATGKIQILSSAQYYSNINNAVSAKANAGFNTTITDYWGRALSYQLVNATDGGPAYTFSSIADDSEFRSGSAPMPILIADGRAPGELLIPSNTTVFEFNPWEMGTFDPTTFAFAPLRYTGSNFSAGVVPDNVKCVRGFDNAGYVMGTSSTLFNQFLLQINSTNTTTPVSQALTSGITSVLKDVGQAGDDIADWVNPFYHYNNATNLNAQSRRLTLVDGGEDLQNIPLHPLIQPVRNVDVIFAIDSSADTVAPAAAGWPNGTSLVATYQRSLNVSQQNGTVFPAIPDTNTFVNLGLNNRPTFFGCDLANMTGQTPLIVYLPNSPYVYNSNVSTFDPAYNNTERNAIIQNGYDVATQGNGTRDAQWPACVGCAILSRSLNRTNTPLPAVCTQCFQRYCWDGTVNPTAPTPYNPKRVLTQINVRSGAARFGATGLALVAAVGAVVAQ